MSEYKSVRVYRAKATLNIGGAIATITADVPAVEGEVEAFRILLEGLNRMGDPIDLELRLS